MKEKLIRNWLHSKKNYFTIDFLHLAYSYFRLTKNEQFYHEPSYVSY